MITIKDIAARLQVSPSTVGRALADDQRISQTMKQKVLEVANEMGYVTNRAARMMRGVSSNLVGLVIPDIRNRFYSTMAHALSKSLEQLDFQLTLSETDDDRLAELRHIRELTSVNVAGIIIVPTARPHPDAVRLLNLTPHVQMLRKMPLFGEQSFGIDDMHALHQATTHLLELGHRRIAYIGGSVELPTGAARVKGFQNALAGTPGAVGYEENGAPGSAEFAREALARLLALPAPPTGLVLGTVQHTAAVLEEIRARGIKVPEQLSVVGFGDELAFSWWGPGLTTLDLPVSELATTCGLWFGHHLKQKSVNAVPYTSISQARLIVRASTQAVDVLRTQEAASA